MDFEVFAQASAKKTKKNVSRDTHELKNLSCNLVFSLNERTTAGSPVSLFLSINHHLSEFSS
jgi:hypothetical protein